MPKSTPIPYAPQSLNPAEAEKESVHEVYEAIAPHFAQTRQRPWPIVSTFLHSLPPSLGLDSGSGNGKYLPPAHSSGHLMFSLDRSSALLEIARHSNDTVNECIRADLALAGWRKGIFDFTISIASIHHLSTPIRRRQAVQALLPPLRLARREPYARFLVHVWAYEQGEGSRRRMGAAASTHTHPTGLIEVIEGRGDGEKVQDVLVPWILQTPRHSTSTEGAIGGDEDGTERKTFHRYYHLFKAGELRDLVHDAAREEGYTIVEEEDGTAGGSGMKSDVKWVRVRGEGWEADNWWLEGEVGIGPPPSPTTGDKR